MGILKTTQMKEIIDKHKEAIRIEIKKYFSVPDNWDKWDYKTQRYSFEDVEESCARITQIQRLEGMIEGINIAWSDGSSDFYLDNKKKELQTKLKALKGE